MNKRVVVLAAGMVGTSLLDLCMADSPKAVQEQDGAMVISITSGSTGGHYNRCAALIDAEFSCIANEDIIQVIPSEGSFQNITRLRNGLADLAIVQRDVLVDRYYNAERPFSAVEILAPLFPEALQVLVHHKDLRGKVSFIEFSQHVRERKIPHLAIGPKGSVTNVTTRLVFDLLGLETPPGFYLETPPSEYINDFKYGDTGQAVAMLSASPVSGLGNDLPFDPGVLSLSDKELDFLTRYLKNLDPVSLPLEMYMQGDTAKSDTAQGDTAQFKTLGTWAVLIGRLGVTEKIVSTTGINDPVHVVLEALSGGNNTYARIFDPKCNMHCHWDLQDGWQLESRGMDAYNFFKGIELSPGLRTSLIDPGFIMPWNTMLLALLLLLAIAYLWVVNTMDPHHDLGPWRRRWYRYQQVVYGVAFFLLIALCLPLLIDVLEQEFCSNGPKLFSPYLDMSWVDKYIWLLVLSLSGQDGGISPLSPAAKVAASSGVVLQYINVAFVAIYTYFKEQRRRKRLKGRAMVNFKEHIVILGWNQNAPKLIYKLVRDHKEYSGRSGRVVVVCPKATELLNADLMIQFEYEQGKFLMGVNEDPKTDHALVQANITQAHTAILLADKDAEDPDERTLIRASAIARQYKGAADSTKKRVYVIAELMDEAHQRSFQDNGVDEVVCSAHYASNVLFQSSIHHGVSRLVEELVDHELGNEFYKIDLDMDSPFLGKTFDKLLRELRTKGVLLLGILDSECTIDPTSEQRTRWIPRLWPQRRKRVGAVSKDCSMMINPSNAMELSYVTKRNDQLYVLAEDRDAIDLLLKQG